MSVKFIDLFAGIGGFHVALKRLGHECVFASEIDEKLRVLYRENFGITPAGDITKVDISSIPRHDILCAGFPCQPFSKAGTQEGMSDILRGNLFDNIVQILKVHRPKYFILENVPNLEKHDEGRTWSIMQTVLKDKLHYDVRIQKLSPHNFGVPQLRNRMFIVGTTGNLKCFQWPKPQDYNYQLDSFLQDNLNDTKPIPIREKQCLELWNKLVKNFPKTTKLPSFPIWAMEFGASYPFEDCTPNKLKSKELAKFQGAFGVSLYRMTKKEQIERLPNYARSKDTKFPTWKKRFIRQNREFYLTYKSIIDPLLPEIQRMPNSWQKLEWNCKGASRNIFDHIIQFRGSGIRVKKANYFPTLVASTSTQRPIIGWKERYLNASEGKYLQSLEDIKLPKSGTLRSKALGNAVNAKIVRLVAEELLASDSLPKAKVNSNFKNNEMIKEHES